MCKKINYRDHKEKKCAYLYDEDFKFEKIVSVFDHLPNTIAH